MHFRFRAPTLSKQRDWVPHSRPSVLGEFNANLEGGVFLFFLFIKFAIITCIFSYILKYNGRIPATAMGELLQAQKLK